MPPPQHRIISIGATDQHPLWPHDPGGRTGHATTTLVQAHADKPVNIITDPGLPPQALAARLAERSPVPPEQITHVFLTSFHPDARRGVAVFQNAALLLAEAEREAVGVHLLQQLERIVEEGEGESDIAATIREDITLLRAAQPAPDHLAEGVDLFPLPGVTPGLAGLLLAHPKYTLLIAGDAAPTREHIEQGKILQRAVDLEQARDSLAEATEIADLIIPGRDDLMLNPLRSPL